MTYKTFTGTENEYASLHHWVRYRLGKPEICENCDGLAGGVRYHWANISGEYKRELDDWARLCSRCHTYIDGPTLLPDEAHPNWNGDKCKKGHEYTLDNLYIKRQLSRGVYLETRICRTCQNEYSRKYLARKREANMKGKS